MFYVVALRTLMLALVLMLAQQNAPNTQGIAPPPGSPTLDSSSNDLFVTSVGPVKVETLATGGADAHCQTLAALSVRAVTPGTPISAPRLVRKACR